MSGFSLSQTSLEKGQDSALVTTSAPTKTPMYQAFNAARYQRQTIINSIQKESGRRLICYVSGLSVSINRNDTLGFVDLLHNVDGGYDLDLLLHTGGGNVDAAEKLISMVRALVGAGNSGSLSRTSLRVREP